MGTNPRENKNSRDFKTAKLLAVAVKTLYDSHNDPPLVGWPEESSSCFLRLVAQTRGVEDKRTLFLFPIQGFLKRYVNPCCPAKLNAKKPPRGGKLKRGATGFTDPTAHRANT